MPKSPLEWASTQLFIRHRYLLSNVVRLSIPEADLEGCEWCKRTNKFWQAKFFLDFFININVPPRNCSNFLLLHKRTSLLMCWSSNGHRRLWQQQVFYNFFPPKSCSKFSLLVSSDSSYNLSQLPQRLLTAALSSFTLLWPRKIVNIQRFIFFSRTKGKSSTLS